MDLQLTGTTAVVTGGTKGIGRAGGVWAGIEGGNPDLFGTALGLDPTGRMARPEEVAYAVTMLTSPRASFVTGTDLVVDSALTRGVQL